MVQLHAALAKGRVGSHDGDAADLRCAERQEVALDDREAQRPQLRAVLGHQLAAHHLGIRAGSPHRQRDGALARAGLQYAVTRHQVEPRHHGVGKVRARGEEAQQAAIEDRARGQRALDDVHGIDILRERPAALAVLALAQPPAAQRLHRLLERRPVRQVLLAGVDDAVGALVDLHQRQQLLLARRDRAHPVGDRRGLALDPRRGCVLGGRLPSRGTVGLASELLAVLLRVVGRHLGIQLVHGAAENVGVELAQAL